jgi:hypothetical protein
MNRLATLALALLAGVSTARAFTCNWNTDTEADKQAWDRQFAQCQLDTERYDDEHPIRGATADETYQLGAQRQIKRFDLCLNAAGWPNMFQISPEMHMVRVLEGWKREGKCSQKDMDFLQSYIDHQRKFDVCLSQHPGDGYKKCDFDLFDERVTPTAPAPSPRPHTTVTQCSTCGGS